MSPCKGLLNQLGSALCFLDNILFLFPPAHKYPKLILVYITLAKSNAMQNDTVQMNNDKAWWKTLNASPNHIFADVASVNYKLWGQWRKMKLHSKLGQVCICGGTLPWQPSSWCDAGTSLPAPRMWWQYAELLCAAMNSGQNFSVDGRRSLKFTSGLRVAFDVWMHW